MSDQEKALEVKNKGNDAFKRKDFPAAIGVNDDFDCFEWNLHLYDCITVELTFFQLLSPRQLVMTEKTRFSNRSAAYASHGDAESALTDAEECVRLKPDWGKGYSRKAAALAMLNRRKEAISTLTEGLKHDPTNAAMKQSLEQLQTEEALSSQSSNYFKDLKDPDVWQRATSNPQVAAMLDSSDVRKAIQEVIDNPQNIAKYMQDERVTAVLGTLMTAKKQISEERQKQEKERVRRQKEDEEKARESKEREKQERQLTEEELAKLSDDERALYYKNQGNKRYKEREFDIALDFYNKAVDVLPEKMEFYNNIAAVYFEMRDYERCLEFCKKAVEVGRKNFADFKLIAKAYARRGNALMKLGWFDEAVKAYEDSLTEDRVYDIEQKLKDAKKKKKQLDDQRYINPDIAAEEKEKGNALFKAGKFAEAMQHYNEAVKRDPSNHIYYSNRAACYTKLGEFPLGLKDCEKSIELCPTFMKAYSRKAAIHAFMKEYHKALKCYEDALKLEPENQEMKDGFARIRAEIYSQGSTSDADKTQRAERAMEDPEIRAIMQDPVMRQVLSDLQSDPKAAQQHLTNASVMEKLQKLIDAGILQMR